MACSISSLMISKCGESVPDKGFPGGSDGKESDCSAGNVASVPESGRYPGEGNGNPLQYSCLGNAMNRGVWLDPKDSDTTE